MSQAVAGCKINEAAAHFLNVRGGIFTPHPCAWLDSFSYKPFLSSLLRFSIQTIKLSSERLNAKFGAILRLVGRNNHTCPTMLLQLGRYTGRLDAPVTLIGCMTETPLSLRKVSRSVALHSPIYPAIGRDTDNTLFHRLRTCTLGTKFFRFYLDALSSVQI